MVTELVMKFLTKILLLLPELKSAQIQYKQVKIFFQCEDHVADVNDLFTIIKCQFSETILLLQSIY